MKKSKSQKPKRKRKYKKDKWVKKLKKMEEDRLKELKAARRVNPYKQQLENINKLKEITKAAKERVELQGGTNGENRKPGQ